MSDKKHTSIRVESEIMQAIDSARFKRPGNVSANTWIVEAIIEKLQRDGITIGSANDA